ncbi:hypothetical protein SELMODRAFT_415905 [Selaginella moellendorffii]|uniref:Uncharacterized protein n=1 Tax=Selaginella moellendorffii TaxID=88036 RepID=D8RYK0_SELML|nr:hypothetical protein SELMODRAFT_415905 [Selaginella moellendorffii]
MGGFGTKSGTLQIALFQDQARGEVPEWVQRKCSSDRNVCYPDQGYYMVTQQSDISASGGAAQLDHRRFYEALLKIIVESRVANWTIILHWQNERNALTTSPKWLSLAQPDGKKVFLILSYLV